MLIIKTGNIQKAIVIKGTLKRNIDQLRKFSPPQPKIFIVNQSNSTPTITDITPVIKTILPTIIDFLLLLFVSIYHLRNNSRHK
jgi:hypothetical protein